ncbi:YdcF family protein [Corynebacterium casei]|uniref:YdcF family protein n=1 Tax=Corynebacterium casei TaxID=160386 RepID=UPI003FD11BE1
MNGLNTSKGANGNRMKIMLSTRGPRERCSAARWRRRIIAFVAPILVLLGLPAWFLFPPQGIPSESDAVLVIAGASDGRHQLGAQLIEDGVSENFVVSNTSGPEDKIGHAHCNGSSRPENATEIWCMKSDPATTTGEALAIGKLAEQKGWSSVTAVTDRPHNHRVRTNLKRCTDLDYSVVSIDDFNITSAPARIAREIGGYIKFWVSNPC